MSRKHAALQYAVIASSAVLLIILLLLFGQWSADFAQTNLVDYDAENSGPIATSLSYETRIAKGDQLFELGHMGLAASEYALAVHSDDSQAEAHYKLGLSYLELHDYDSALNALSSAMERSSNHPTHTTAYARTLMASEDFEQAKAVFESLEAQGQLQQESHFYWGILNSYLGQYDSAQHHFEQALNQGGSISHDWIDPFLNTYEHFDAQQGGQVIYLKLLLAQAMIDAEEYEVSAATSWQVTQEQIDYRDAWLILGYAKLQLKDYNNAEMAFLEAKYLDSSKAETHYFLGTTHYLQEEYEEAIQSFEVALIHDFQPQEEIYRQMSEANLSLGRYEDALEAYEYLIQINPSSIDLFVKPIWIALDKLSDSDRALTLAEQAVDLFPGEAMSHNLLGWAYLEEGELASAESEIQTALNIDDELAAAHYNLGLILEQKDERQAAADAFKTAHELADPSQDIYAMAAEKYNSLLNP